MASLALSAVTRRIPAQLYCDYPGAASLSTAIRVHWGRGLPCLPVALGAECEVARYRPPAVSSPSRSLPGDAHARSSLIEREVVSPRDCCLSCLMLLCLSAALDCSLLLDAHKLLRAFGRCVDGLWSWTACKKKPPGRETNENDVAREGCSYADTLCWMLSLLVCCARRSLLGKCWW